MEYRVNEDDGIKEVSLVTGELLSRIRTVKNNSRETILFGAEKVMEGMNLFEKLLLTMNPQEINDEVVETIETVVDRHLTTKEYDAQYIDHCVRYGITICFTILEAYNNLKKGKSRSLEKY